jgi:hypothetical protein
VEEVSPSDRSDLALGEETCHGNPAHPFLKRTAIVMGLAEESFPPAAAAKHERPPRLVLVFGTVRGEEHVQVFGGGFRVAKMKLNGLAFLDNVTNDNRARLLVCPDEITHEKIASFESASMFVDDDADVQHPMGLLTLRSLQRLERVLEAFKSRFATEFIDQVVVGPGDHEAFADGATAL